MSRTSGQGADGSPTGLWSLTGEWMSTMNARPVAANRSSTRSATSQAYG
nr:hypothetical protein [Gordonia neofelifaecis]